MAEFQNFRLGDAVSQGQGIAMNNLRLGQAQRQVQSQQGLTQALQAGTPEAMTQYGQQFPQEAMQYQSQNSEMRKKELEGKLFEFSVIEKLMSGVQDENTFQQAKQMMGQAGMDVSKIPPNFDPNYIMQQRNQALGVKGQMEMELRNLDKKRADATFEQTKLRDEETKRKNLANEGIQRDRTAAASAAAAAKAAAGPKLTEGERVASGYALRMEEAENLMEKVPKGEQKPGVDESILSTMPGIGKVSSNAARSDQRQSYRQAQEDWVRSKLRKESGAVIADEEMDREIRVYFPQLGDGEKVIAQKKQARKVAMEAMKQAAGNAYKASPNKNRNVVRTGTLNGRKVVQYDDGTTDYAD